MTDLLAHAALFGFGLWVGLRSIAAGYALIDLWYAIDTHYPRVIARIAAWAAVTLSLAWWLEGSRRTAFCCGWFAFLAFQLSLYQLRYLIVPRRPS